MALGFQFRETMTGTYHLLATPLDERAITFTIAAKVDGLRRFLKDKVATIEGEVDVEGFADKRPLHGTLGLKLLDERRLPYEFTFRGNDEREYRFRGQKDFAIIAVTDSMTVLPASLYDAEGNEIGRATLRFDMQHDMRTFLRSWKLRAWSWPSLRAATS
jgi:hypothetical protein